MHGRELCPIHKNGGLGEMKKIGIKIGEGVLALLPPAAFFYLLEFYTRNPFEQIRPWAHLFNLILFEGAFVILALLCGRLRMAYRIEGILTMVFGIANAYVVRFRTNPIVPWDVFSWRTAASVANNYDFTPDGRMVVVTLLFVAILAALQPVKVKIKFPVWKREIPAVALVVVLALFSNVLQQEDFQNSHRLYNKLFTPTVMTKYDGTMVTFVMNMAYMAIDKPSGYSAAEAQETLASYEGDTSGENTSDGDVSGEDESSSEQNLPNIIVIMDEAFSDLAVLGDFTVNQDYMPFVHQLQQGADNTVTGMLNVSVCGGNTANTEFEFLTGNTMAFLPQGSVPYQQYVNGETTSLASHLQDLGYQTVATHPYNASGWERDRVYGLLGFEESIFKEGYLNATRIRDYISDESCVDKIIDLYENKQSGQPLFVFNVTMQNHGGYQDAYDNFTPDIYVEGVNNFALEQYLSLIEQTDAAMEKLIDYFSTADEDTIILFFGDHQPNDTVASSILSLNGMSWNSLDEEELKLRYQVPYVMWANYDIGEEQNADTSANYLAAELLERAGVPTDAYQNFLLELKESYPIISTVRVQDADGDEVSLEDIADDVNEYQQLQYYQLFDED